MAVLDLGPSIFVGLDDTDTLDTPGTNQLARHLVRELAPIARGRLILRHQLFEDPRVPCTKKNGCASIELESLGPAALTDLVARLRDLILDWIPSRSDPGLAIAESIPPEIATWGQRAKCELLTQKEARALADAHNIYLEGLAGTQDGVIGALAALGLLSSRNDGRVVYLSSPAHDDALDITGLLDVDTVLARGIDAVVDCDTGEPVSSATIEVGKKLRPNYRAGRILLYAARRDNGTYEAIRVP
ncbi:MAG: hypothetical protein AB7G28_13625 [Pirellulales bacterium]